MSCICGKCGHRWALTIGGDGKIVPNINPHGRSVGRCYCGARIDGGDE